MPSWQEEYLAALQARDIVEKPHQSVLQHYTKLADKVAALQNGPSEGKTAAVAHVTTNKVPEQSDQSGGADGKPPSSPSPSGETLASVRRDLGEAQRSRGVMETRLQEITEEIQKLKLQAGLDRKQINELARERAGLVTGVRDRDEELKGKAKLLEGVHDETVSLTLQLNMADERMQKLEEENKELVDRWMKKMAQEADAMNDKSRFS